MNCPICQYEGLDTDAEICPSCKTELIAFSSMRAIGRAYRRQKNTIWVLVVLFVIVLAGALIMVLLEDTSDKEKDHSERTARLEASVQTLQAENQKLKTENAELKAKKAELLAIEEEVTPKETIHVVKKGETLYLLANQYFGDGKQYKKIVRDNNISNPNVITTGQELIIKH